MKTSNVAFILLIIITLLSIPVFSQAIDTKSSRSTDPRINDEYRNSLISEIRVSKFSMDYVPMERLAFKDTMPDYGAIEKPVLFSKKMSLKSGLPKVVDSTLQIGAAFIANFALHELGHVVLADYVGAKGANPDFIKMKDGKFFLGVSTIEEIDDESMLPYSLAGEVASDVTFEHALKEYREDPTGFNTSMLILSGTDFLRYCVYAFYMSEGHGFYDPVSIANESEISRDTIFALALAKTAINAYRVYSGKDYVVPYFMVTKNTATMNFLMPF